MEPLSLSSLQISVKRVISFDLFNVDHACLANHRCRGALNLGGCKLSAQITHMLPERIVI